MESNLIIGMESRIQEKLKSLKMKVIYKKHCRMQKAECVSNKMRLATWKLSSDINNNC